MKRRLVLVAMSAMVMLGVAGGFASGDASAADSRSLSGNVWCPRC